MADFKALLNDPTREVQRVGEFVGIDVNDEVTLPLRTLRDQLAVSQGGGAGEVPDSLAALLPRTEALGERSRELLARPLTPPRTAKWSAPTDSPLRSVYTQSFPEFLNQLGGSMLVSTYQTGKLICARHDGGNSTPTSGTSRGRWGWRSLRGGLRSAPARRSSTTATSRRWLPRSSRRASTMPASSPEQALHRRHPHPRDRFRQGRAVAGRDQLLLSRDARRGAQLHPPLEAAVRLGAHERGPLPPERTLRDRRRAGYVTALGETDAPGRWRENKAGGGILIDVETGEPFSAGFRCPTHRDGTTGGCGCSSRARGRSRSRIRTTGRSRPSRSYRASPVALSSREAWRSSVSRRSARPPPSAGCR